MDNVVKHPSSPKYPGEMDENELRTLVSELGLGLLVMYTGLAKECPVFLDTPINKAEDDRTWGQDLKELLDQVFPGQTTWEGNRIVKMHDGS